jgi:hypothetical protein
MRFIYIMSLLPLLVTAAPLARPVDNTALDEHNTQLDNLNLSSADGSKEAATAGRVSSDITNAEPASQVNTDLDATQDALNTAEAQRAKDQQARSVIPASETADLNSLETLQTTEAQPEIDALKSAGGATTQNIDALESTFATGATLTAGAKKAVSIY